MKLSTKVVSEVLQNNNSIQLKNHCKIVLDSYLMQEPNLTENELIKALEIYLQGLDQELTKK